MANWNGLDFLIFLILTLNTILGLARGATREIISLMCLSIALVFMIKFTVPLAQFFNSTSIMVSVVNNPLMQNFMLQIGAGAITVGLLQELMYSISLLICFVGIFSTCEAALGAQFFVEFFSFPYAMLNRKVGGSLGFTRGYILCLILLSIMTHIYSAGTIKNSFLSGSFFARLFSSQTQALDQLISDQTPEYYHRLYENKPYSEEDIYKNIGSPTSPLTSPSSSPNQVTE